jgi:hypothetical protein
MKNSNYTIGNRTRDLPTAPPRGRLNNPYISKSVTSKSGRHKCYQCDTDSDCTSSVGEEGVSCRGGINLLNGISAMRCGGGVVLYLKEEGRETDGQTFCACENQKTSSNVLYWRTRHSLLREPWHAGTL